MSVIIISRNQEKLDRAARKIGNVFTAGKSASQLVCSLRAQFHQRSFLVLTELTTGREVKVIAADFTKDDRYGHIQENIEGLEIGILVNNVGILPSKIPCKLLETSDLEERIYDVINCNVKAMVKMCRIVLPGMQQRGRGVILNVSSGIAKIPCPIYTLYAASKMVAPFGVSTPMTGHQKPDMVTFTPEEFVRSSLKYLKAGDQTYGSVTHTILGGIVQSIPTWVLQSEAFQHHFREYVKEKVGG
uniref:Hydroxysteroid (17-beta) dehydrogenase 3 n=1 Tax=Cyprinus carpio TaxID=7962 RepID=A0A8C1YPB3_CYPCA